MHADQIKWDYLGYETANLSIASSGRSRRRGLPPPSDALFKSPANGMFPYTFRQMAGLICGLQRGLIGAVARRRPNPGPLSGGTPGVEGQRREKKERNDK